MQKKSWIILGICLSLLGVLWIYILQSRGAPRPLTQPQMVSMLNHMRDAVEHKNVRELMSYVSPGDQTRISNMNVRQLRVLLTRTFSDSDTLQADYSNLIFKGGEVGSDALAEFDLVVTHHLPEGVADDYRGHISLKLQSMEIPHLMGLYHTNEWRIVNARTNGPDLSTYGDYIDQ